LAVVVLTLNEEECIERCLQSVTWADEIVLVDTGSTDATVDIARRFTDKVYVRPLSTFSGQRNFGADMCDSDWVLFLDADEEATEAFRSETEGLLASGAHEAYYVSFATFMFGGWLRHYPSLQYHIRLYSPSSGRWVGDVHERVVTSGSCGFMTNTLRHYSHENIAAFLDAARGYISLEVEQATTRPRWLLARMAVMPPAYFVKTYLLQGGWLDGSRGFAACAMRSTYELVRWLSYREKFAEGNRSTEPRPAASTVARAAIRLKKRLLQEDG